MHVDTGGVTKALDELMGYNALATELGWADQSDMMPKKMDELLRRQLSIIVGKANDWVLSGCHLFNIPHQNRICVWEQNRWTQYVYNRDTPDGFSHEGRVRGHSSFQSPPAPHPWHWEEIEPNTWKNKCTSATQTGDHPVLGKPNWTNLSPHDWTQVLGSLLLASSNKHFYLRFGREKMLLERHLRAFDSYLDPLFNASSGHTCDYCGKCTTANSNTDAQICFHSSFVKKFMMKGKYVNGAFTPDFPDIYKACVRVEVPELLSDPKHWGNTFWMYCEFKESQK
jgi:hypothetical protein